MGLQTGVIGSESGGGRGEGRGEPRGTDRVAQPISLPPLGRAGSLSELLAVPPEEPQA